VRVVIRAPSGRQRFNVLGALDAITRQVITVTNETYITASEVCRLLTKLVEQNPKGTVITVVLDNARYQRCKAVQARAVELGIELLFVPTYSPNLNLIERLWKFVKKECLYGKYYESFEPFKQAITKCLEEAMGCHQAALATLLTLEFQTLQPATSAR
jgi:transposase